MPIPTVDWNSVFEFAWRILVFVVAIGILVVVSGGHHAHIRQGGRLPARAPDTGLPTSRQRER